MADFSPLVVAFICSAVYMYIYLLSLVFGFEYAKKLYEEDGTLWGGNIIGEISEDGKLKILFFFCLKKKLFI